MAKRMQWDPSYGSGNKTIDDQHQALLVQCNTLADRLADSSAEGDRRFLEGFEQLMASVRAHFATEKELLERNAYPQLVEHGDEGDEFEYLASEIITTENFDKDELQTFVALWCIGHIRGTVKQQRAYLEQTATS